MKIVRAKEIGFCYGVNRAIAMLEKEAKEHGGLDSLGAVVHNEQVQERLSRVGVNVILSLDEIKNKTVAISSHGVSPQVEADLRAREVRVIDTTCPFVKRAQLAARRLAEAGFGVLIFGDSRHPEVKGILGWAQGKGQAVLDLKPELTGIPRRLGILSQTTQIPEHFNQFVKNVVDQALTRDAEIRISDTICHDIRQRQIISLELAQQVDLMLVVGGRSSANTQRLVELCSAVTTTYLIDQASGINPDWLRGKNTLGIASGTSTSVYSIDDVQKKLEMLTSGL
jgi:4-hydroxy-3-methylbut-2-en-1-yl diphosphate reductase